MYGGVEVRNIFNKKFVTTFFKYLVIFGIIGMIVCTGIFYVIAINVDKIDYNAIGLNFSSIVYALNEDGEYTEYDRIYGEQNRLWLDIAEMPDYLPNAFIAIEDERFYSHFGFDIPRTVKATFNYIIKKDASFGGSTLNQQLIKNITGNAETTAKRKIIEIFRSIDMDRKLSKDEILELYLNTIYLSQGCNGVETAAQKYFGRSASELTLAQAASIAGITQFPSMYDPILNPENNKQKQELVLAKMLELEMINQSEYDAAITEKLEFENINIVDGTSEATQSYFVDRVVDEVIKDLQTDYGVSETVAVNMVFSGGLKIYSTVDRNIQKAVEKVFENPSDYMYYDEDNPVQAAMVIMDPYTGQVKAIAGGLGKKEGDRTLNRAYNTTRQPGSSIKPLTVYGPGFERGAFTPSTVIVDEEYKEGSHIFKNSYKDYKGAMSVRRAVELSVNTVAARALHKVGIENAHKFGKENFRLSLVDRDKATAPLALGGLTNGLSVSEMTAAYCVFANNGYYNSPYTYTKVVDSNGKVILENKPEKSVAMSKKGAQLTLNVLRGVVQRGTGTGAWLSGGIDVAGKTGTTDSNYDRWFMGITPYYVGGCWFGFDIPKSTGMYGGNPALNLWKACMTEAHKGLKSKSFDFSELTASDMTTKEPVKEEEEEEEETEETEQTVSVRICLDSGLIASDLCAMDSRGSRIVNKNYGDEQLPTATCTGHQSVTIDKSTGCVATPNCPLEQVQKVVMYLPNISECPKH